MDSSLLTELGSRLSQRDQLLGGSRGHFRRECGRSGYGGRGIAAKRRRTCSTWRQCVALNFSRVSDWLEGVPRAAMRASRFARLAA